MVVHGDSVAMGLLGGCGGSAIIVSELFHSKVDVASAINVLKLLC